LNTATHTRTLKLLPSTEELEGFRNESLVKAKSCTFDDINVLPGKMKVATVDDWLELSDFEETEERAGRDPWRHVMDELGDKKVMPVGTLYGTHNRIVAATPIDAMTGKCTGETIPHLLYFALPICTRTGGTRGTISDHTCAIRRLTCVQIPASDSASLKIS
jgi:hypothetical protein